MQAIASAKGVMKPGMIFTIEPMINVGSWRDTTWPDNWTAVTADGSLSAQFEHTVLVTEDGYDILTQREAWFDHWAPEATIGKTELLRALTKTFGISRDVAELRSMAELVENVFGAFDHSGNGRIDRSDFLVPNIGLADALVAACMHRMRARGAEAGGEAPG